MRDGGFFWGIGFEIISRGYFGYVVGVFLFRFLILGFRIRFWGEGEIGRLVGNEFCECWKDSE